MPLVLGVARLGYCADCDHTADETRLGYSTGEATVANVDSVNRRWS